MNKRFFPVLIVWTVLLCGCADDEARDHAHREKALQLAEQWREAGYHVISMRDDFKTIYGDGVEKTEFSFQ